jgi:hypothetical protein
MVHWLFATGLLLLGLFLLSEAIVGREVWQARRWRAYLWPGLAFVMGLFMWPVMAFYTNSAIHMYAHGSWAEVLMLAGGAEIALVHGRLKSRWWHLTMPLAFVVLAGMLYCDRDLAPVFGHLSPLAGVPHR